MNQEFENHSRVTAKILEEFAWNRSRGTKLLSRFFVIGYIVILAVTAVTTVQNGVLNPLNGWLVFLGACMLVYLWYGPHRAAKKAVSAVEDACDGEIPETVLTFGEEIVSDSALGEVVYDYDQILKIYSLKRSYILLMDNKKGLPVSREGFTKGSFSEFKEFLREKRPDLKVPE